MSVRNLAAFNEKDYDTIDKHMVFPANASIVLELQVPDSHFGWYAPFCRCDNSTQDTSSQSGPNLGWQCVSQGVRKTSRCNARAFPAQSTDLFCALHLLLRQLQDPHLRRKSRSPKVRYALFVSSARVDTDTTLPHMTSTIAAAVY